MEPIDRSNIVRGPPNQKINNKTTERKLVCEKEPAAVFKDTGKYDTKSYEVSRHVANSSDQKSQDARSNKSDDKCTIC